MNDQGIEKMDAELSAIINPSQAGAMLRDAREAQGLHIGALAVALKVSVKKLEALESGSYDQLPDIMFARALALSACRALKIDPTPIMTGLPALPASRIKTVEMGLNTAFKDTRGGSRGNLLAKLSSPVGLGVVLLLLVIGAILVWPAKPGFDKAASSASSASQIENRAQGTAGSANALPSPVTEQAVAVPVIVPASALVITDSTSSSTAAATHNPAAMADGSNTPAMLELNAQGGSWVEVTDADGLPILRKFTAKGDVLRVTGKLPLSVVVGRADLVTVTVRGQPLDLKPLAQKNVARFEVK